MKKIAMAILLSLGAASQASADPIGLSPVALVYGIIFVIAEDLNPPIRECDKAPLVKARHKGESGYTFMVTQCELQSNDGIEKAE